MIGTLYGVGLGPGDPELMTLKAHRLIAAAPVIAYPAATGVPSFAREIAAQAIGAGTEEIPMEMPMRTDRFPAIEVYDRAAKIIASHLVEGKDVVVLCEGDPFLFGSFMYLYERLAADFPCEVVPGVSSVPACAAALGRPLAARNDVLTIVPGPLENARIRPLIEAAEAVAIMKVGRHLPRLKALLAEMDLLHTAGYVERASLPNMRVMPLADLKAEKAPYFSVILIYKGEEPWQLPRQS
ncbi:precorrin-2 C(20)-methyltransferase [Polycladidibacter hongkongensis]|uniref:precorrin-2 C(20)-methyltransferase n=1 Tax=Polycladidibacter hongkongensis TaxID=1647556 RepID=UPI000AAE255E|nr:precorrin-2 C(20)-methyltransferase [Pseudovibrio hongkongensis]